MSYDPEKLKRELLVALLQGLLLLFAMCVLPVLLVVGALRYLGAL